MTTAEWVFGIAGIVSALAAVAAIIVAILTLLESNRLRRRGIRETRLDHAERQLEALGRLATVIHRLDNNVRNNRFLEAVQDREEILVVVTSHQLDEEFALASVRPLFAEPKADMAWEEQLTYWNEVSEKARAVLPEARAALRGQAERVHELSAPGPNE